MEVKTKNRRLSLRTGDSFAVILRQFCHLATVGCPTLGRLHGDLKHGVSACGLMCETDAELSDSDDES